MKILRLLILFLCLFATPCVYAGDDAIIGVEEVMSDSIALRQDDLTGKILAMHPLLKNITSEDSIVVLPRKTTNRTAYFFLALLLCFLYSLLRLVFPRYFQNLFMIFTNLAAVKRNIREQLENDNRASLWFYATFLFSLGFLVFELVQRHASVTFPFGQGGAYLVCTFAVMLLITLRTGLSRLVGWVFNQSENVQLVLFNKRLVNEFLGLVLFPLGLLILVSTGSTRTLFFWMAIFSFLLLLAYSYIRNMLLVRNWLHLSILHFLLYLCAFELIPVLILLKLLR